LSIHRDIQYTHTRRLKTDPFLFPSQKKPPAGLPARLTEDGTERDNEVRVVFPNQAAHRGGPITPSLFLQAKSRKVPTRTRRLTFFFYDQKAVHVVVNSPTTVAQLTTWVDALSVTQKKGMPLTEIEKWNKYGDLVYEEDAAFETLF
jgi:hypothetical protein